MQDKVNGGSQKKSVGEIGVQPPQDEREGVQRRTFTRWMNVFLQRRDPPLEVHNLFTDIQDGRILMALLEELSGCKLLYRFRSSSHRIFRLNNISKALAFLDDRHVRLLGIDASGVADGIPSVVLNLIWSMILYFQVKEVTGGLQRHLSSSLSSLSMSSYPSSSDLSPQPNDIGSYSCSTLPSKGRKAAREPKYHGKAIKTLLQWVQRCTSKFGVEVRDFGKSWRSGLAFLALIKSINPALVDLRESLSREPRENIQQAFMIAHHSLDIPPLLEPEDVSGTSPDEQSIITYVSMFLGHCSGTDEDYTTYRDIPKIPHFGSLDSLSFGETLADDPEAQALVRGLERSSEQRLWKQWASRSPGCSQATSPFNKKKNRTLQPPSPLNTGVVSQEIRSWMEEAAADQGYSKPRADESHFSLSSEEGIYTLPALDPDEEDAYSYILDLNKEVFQPYNQQKRQVARVEEETEEEMFLNTQQTEESKHLEICKETLNGSGWKHQEGSLANVDSEEVSAQSVVHTMFDWDKNEQSFREMENSIAVFEPEGDSTSREEHGDERVVRGDFGGYCEEERKKEMTENGCDKSEALVDETKNTKPFEEASRKTEVEKEIENYREVSEKRVENEEKEGENMMTFEEGKDRKSGKGKEEEDKEEEKANEQSFKVGVNDRVLSDKEVGGAGATGSNTKDENDGLDGAPKVEDVTCKDEDKEEYSDEVMNSMDFGEVGTVEEKEFKIKRRELTDKKATTDRPDKTDPKSDTNGCVSVHGGDRWTPACAPTSSFRRAEIRFPKFQLRKSYSLESLLRNSGVTSIFSDSADFLGISQKTLVKAEVMLELEETKSEDGGRPDIMLDFSVPPENFLQQTIHARNL